MEGARHLRHSLLAVGPQPGQWRSGPTLSSAPSSTNRHTQTKTAGQTDRQRQDKTGWTHALATLATALYCRVDGTRQAANWCRMEAWAVRCNTGAVCGTSWTLETSYCNKCISRLFTQYLEEYILYTNHNLHWESCVFYSWSDCFRNFWSVLTHLYPL